jgi:hypothetical protein
MTSAKKEADSTFASPDGSQTLTKTDGDWLDKDEKKAMNILASVPNISKEAIRLYIKALFSEIRKGHEAAIVEIGKELDREWIELKAENLRLKADLEAERDVIIGLAKERGELQFRIKKLELELEAAQAIDMEGGLLQAKREGFLSACDEIIAAAKQIGPHGEAWDYNTGKPFDVDRKKLFGILNQMRKEKEAEK